MSAPTPRCPWCGHVMGMESRDNWRRWFMICNRCGAEGPRCSTESAALAASARPAASEREHCAGCCGSIADTDGEGRRPCRGVVRPAASAVVIPRCSPEERLAIVLGDRDGIPEEVIDVEMFDRGCAWARRNATVIQGQKAGLLSRADGGSIPSGGTIVPAPSAVVIERPIVASSDTCDGAERIDGTRITCEAVASRFAAGESVAALASDYEQSEATILACIRRDYIVACQHVPAPSAVVGAPDCPICGTQLVARWTCNNKAEHPEGALVFNLREATNADVPAPSAEAEAKERLCEAAASAVESFFDDSKWDSDARWYDQELMESLRDACAELQRARAGA